MARLAQKQGSRHRSIPTPHLQVDISGAAVLVCALIPCREEEQAAKHKHKIARSTKYFVSSLGISFSFFILIFKCFNLHFILMDSNLFRSTELHPYNCLKSMADCKEQLVAILSVFRVENIGPIHAERTKGHLEPQSCPC